MFDLFWLGLVQGLTEFLPVSSSGHLVLVEKFLHLTPDLSRELWFHAASLLAVIGFFWQKIWQLVRGGFLLVTRGENKEEGLLAIKLLTASVMTATLALPLSDIGKETWGQDETILGIFFFISAGFIFTAYWSHQKQKNLEKKFSWPIVLGLGLVQGLAILPGISRSGITIAFLIACGLAWKKSAEISFLLSIPTVAGAVILKLDNSPIIPWGNEEMVGWWFSFIFCVIISWAVIRFMLHFLNRYWNAFGIYCIFLGGLIIWLDKFYS